MRTLVVLSAAAALVFVPCASAKTVRVNWREQVVLDGERVMRLRVDAFAFGADRWAVRLSFTNTSPRLLTLIRNDFALALYEPGARDACRFRPLRATTFWPRKPQRLDPGQTWRGVFGGQASLPENGSLRIVISRFSGGPQSFPRFGWLTDHVYDLGLRRGRLAVAPTCR